MTTNPDISYEDYRRLIQQLAGKAFMRMRAAGIPFDLEDIIGHMNISFVKAKRAFDSNKGYKFSTYLVRSIWNDFNKLAAKLSNEAQSIGFLSVQDMSPENENGEFYNDVYSTFSDDTAPSAEDAYSEIEEARAKLRLLSKQARRVIRCYLVALQSKDMDVTLSRIVRELDMKPHEIKYLKNEFERHYGVSMEGVM
jgi:DNA-directed RNA polymerase specialized sigma subunit